MALDKAGANAQVDALINDNASNEISELDVRTTLKQNIDGNMNLEETATQEMKGSINMAGNSIFNIANFAPGTSVNEDHGAVVMTDNVTAQGLVLGVPEPLENFTSNGPDQNTTPDFTTNSMTLDNAGVWLVGYHCNGTFGINNSAIAMAIALDGVETVAADKAGVSNSDSLRFNLSGVAPILVTAGQTLTITVVADATGSLVAEDASIWAVRCAESELTPDLEAQIQRGTYGGWIESPNLTVNGGNNKQFDISAGTGMFVDFTDPSNVMRLPYSYPGSTGNVGTLLGSAAIRQSFISINNLGVIQQRSVEPTGNQGEEELFLGNLTHGNDLGTNDVYDDATDTPFTDYSMIRTVRVFIRSFGGVNSDGLIYGGVPGTLSLTHTSGTGLVLGRNYFVNKSFPDSPEAVAENPVPVVVRKYEDTSGNLVTIGTPDAFIDPNTYNNNGTLTALGPNKWSIQRIFFFYGSNTTIVYQGNAQYNSLGEAQNGIITEVFTEHPDTKQAVFRGYLLVQEGATDLDNPIQAEFRTIGSLRPLGSAQGLSQVVTVQDAYDNGPLVLINTTNGPLSLQVDPGGSDGDLLQVWKNLADNIKASITGNGLMTVTNLSALNLVYPNGFTNEAAFPSAALNTRGIGYDLAVDKLRYSNGTSWLPLAVEGGASTIASAFAAQLLTLQTINLNSTATLLYDSEVYDVDNEYNPVTGIFTANRAGLYNFSAGVNKEPSPSGGGRLRLQFLVDDGVTPVNVWSNINSETQASDQGTQISGDILLAIGDEVSVDCRWNFGSANIDITADPGVTFSGHYIGPIV